MTDETERDVKRSLEAHLTQAKAVSRLRHRADRLEGAVRTVLNEHRMAEDWSLPKRLEEYLLGVMADIDEPKPQGGELADRLSAALDSREDEGETPVHRRRVANLVAQLKDEILIGGGFTETAAKVYDEINRELGTLAAPVHAAAHEGDGNVDKFRRPTMFGAEERDYEHEAPTDEPVSGEGDETVSVDSFVDDHVERGCKDSVLNTSDDLTFTVEREDGWWWIVCDTCGNVGRLSRTEDNLPTHADARSELPPAYYLMAVKAIEAKADEGWYRNEAFARQVARAFHLRLSDRHEEEGERDG